MKTILVDPSRCIQCCNCQNACKDEFCDNDWSPSASQQGSGQFWIRVHENQAAAGSRMRLERTPVLCQHCENPVCLAACVQDAIYKREDGIVIIDPDKCNGCGSCAEACHYGVIFKNDDSGIFQKCTMCAHLLDEGWDQPRCVTACPVDALTFIDEEDQIEENLYAPLERFHPEYGTNPRVAYVNLPKPFIAGAVYSPADDLCLEKASITLEGQVNQEIRNTETGIMGEFYIDNVKPGIYAMTIRKDGYDTKTITRLDLRGALNAGEIRLMKTPE